MEADPEMATCFLCLNSFKVVTTELNRCHGNEKTGDVPGLGQISQKFLMFTENQLGLPLKDFFVNVDQLGNTFCGECSNVVCMICSLYDDFCSVQARLKMKVDQLLDLLERSSKKEGGNDSGGNTQADMMGIRGEGHFKEVVEKRSQLKQHCKQYCQATGKYSLVPGNLSEDEADERVEIKSEIGSLIGDEDQKGGEGKECTSLQNEMEIEMEAIENESDASSVQSAESPGSPAEIEDDDKEDFSAAVADNSDSDWKGESETENDDRTSSNHSETDNSNDEFEEKKTKTKIKTVKIIRSKEAETTSNGNLEDSVYNCDQCGKPYVSKGHLERHLGTVHGLGKKGRLTCHLCGEGFSQKSSLMRHKDSKHNGSPEPKNIICHTCTKCDQSFQRKGCIDKHMVKVHGIGSMKSFIYKCNLCEKGFNVKASLVRHQRWSHKIKPTKKQTPFFCKTCQRYFKTSKSLREHHNRTHEDINLSSTSTPPQQPDNPYKFESETGNVDGSSSNHSETGNHNSNEFEDKNIDKEKEKTELPKTNTVKNARSTGKEANDLNDNLDDSIYKCDKCGKPYISKGYLDRHLRTVHGVGKSCQVTCNFCGKGFSCHQSLMRHKDSKHNDNTKSEEDVISHNCTKCEQSFQKKGWLDKHMFKRHGIGSLKSFIYKCNLCEKGFNIKGSLNRHQRWDHKINPTKTQTLFFCEICSYKSTTYLELVKHVNLKHGIDRKLVSKPVNCKICLETCKDNYSLQKHVNLVHQSKMEVGCPKCSMKFDTRRQLIHHKYSVHKKDEITTSFMKRLESAKGNINDEVKENCVVCNEEFSSWEVLRSHLKIHEDEISVNEKSLRCFKCDKLFSYEQTIWAHLRSSKRHDFTTVEFPCDHGDHLGYSQWVFQTPTQLETHFKEGHQDCGILKCEQCGWPFLDKNMLDLHRLLHIPRINKKYQCPVCPNTFLNQDTLQGHYNPVHGVSLKLFRCQVCTWGFATKGGLTAHARTHETTEVHDFLCSKCPRSFKSAIQLRDHIRQIHVSRQCPDCGIVVQRSRYSHHRKIKHTPLGILCMMCGMAFRDNPGLKKHMAFHGEYHFKCQYCGKGCVSGWYLKKHIRKVHKEQTGNDGAK